ncbi:MAG: type II toxin-antitoxin system VapC family toxin [Thiohalocapsa sp.]
MLYLDTSLLVAALTNEANTERIQQWLGGQDPDTLAISEWVATEFSAALSIKLRVGDLPLSARDDALAAFERLRGENLTVLPISGLHFRLAAHLADQHALGLRAGDALHLAVCLDYRALLNTLDRRLAEAGAPLGVATAIL